MDARESGCRGAFVAVPSPGDLAGGRARPAGERGGGPADARAEHFATGMLWMIACATPTMLALVLFRHYRTASAAHDAALREMAARSQTVDRLLDFSQTIQGAGKPEQIFDSLALFLHTELSLSGVAIIAHEPGRAAADVAQERLPRDAEPLRLLARRDGHRAVPLPPPEPAALLQAGGVARAAARSTRRFASRPTIRRTASRSPSAARRSSWCTCSCRRTSTWTEDRRQLAQTYINTASSSLITLHHLAEAERQSLTDALTGLVQPPVDGPAASARGRAGGASRRSRCRWS